ncbi:MAG: manganese catalase family protein [Oscillospiraceae bacterium]|nr:manganese catalase family protein [Oscillospiraceae bacterium]MBQ9938460.1 manganese catalase family protein [Oscillospiraceae bacterium]
MNNPNSHHPAPSTETFERNPAYAAVLYNDFAGSLSEFSAVAKYFYQHLILQKTHPELASDLMAVSVKEMQHLKLLGELIVNLGGDPKFRNLEHSRESYWCGNRVNYSRNLQYLLMENIKDEQKSVAAYRLHICQIKNTSAQAVLEYIISDELEHIKIFESWLERLTC